MKRLRFNKLVLRITNLFSIVLFLQISYAQNVVFHSQAEVDAFDPSTTVIDGHLTIGTNSITDINNLSNLSNLETVKGNLSFNRNGPLNFINGMTSLTTVEGNLSFNRTRLFNINGLSALKTVGGNVRISYNIFLSSVGGFPQLESIGGDIEIRYNDGLERIEDLSNLNKIGGEFIIFGNEVLESIEGLNNLDSLHGFIVEKNNELQSIDGYNNLERISGYVTINDNGKLEVVGGFSSLTRVDSSLAITNNKVLEQIVGFNNLKTVNGELLIQLNRYIKDINSFSNLEHVGSNISIRSNIDLVDINGLNNLKSVQGYLSISANSSLESLEGLINLDSIYGSFFIRNNDELLNTDGLDGLQYIGSSLEITYNEELVKISEMPMLKSRLSRLFIRYNPKLKLIEDFPLVNSIETIYITDNALLENLSGLNSLDSIYGWFQIVANDALENLSGLENVVFIGESLYIQENTTLTNIDALSKLKNIGGSLEIDRNPNFANVDGFENLNSIGGRIEMRDNPALQNFDGFSNLDSIGGIFKVYKNNSLTNLDGLSNLDYVNGKFSLFSNDLLSDCCGIKHLIQNPSKVNGSISISGNIAGCISQNAISNADCGLEFYVLSNPPCQSLDNGSFQIDIVHYKSSPFSYQWVNQDNGQSGQGVSYEDVFLIEGLETGNYEIMITTPTPDTAIRNDVWLPELDGSVFEIIKIKSTNSSNGLSNGSLNITVDHGFPPYSIIWSGQESGSESGIMDPNIVINSLSQGEYVIKVQDNLGTQQEVAVTLLDETFPVFECEKPLDIVILNDVSGSVDAVEYKESQEFFVDLIKEVNLGNGDEESRVGIIEWSSSNLQMIKIPISGEISQLEEYLDMTRSFGGGTSPHEALEFGYEYLSENARPDVEKVLILSTDGTSGQISSSLVSLCDTYKAAGYHIVTIAFDGAFRNAPTRKLLQNMASIDQLAPGAPAYSDLDADIASNIVHIYLCPIDPGSSATTYFNRDGAIDITDIEPVGNCFNFEYVDITFTVEAKRELSIPASTPITFYFNNPKLFGATPILTWLIPCGIASGNSETYTVRLSCHGPSQIYAVLNDDGTINPPIAFPITDIEELAYSNNIDNESVCLEDYATLQAIKFTDTPIPSCDTIVNYTINICNISPVDAFDVSVEDQAPDGFSIINTIINDNGCSEYQNGTFDIPAECCVTIILTYDASNALHAFYGDQDVILSGPDNQQYINFDGALSASEDLNLDGSIDCPSTNIEFIKEVNVDHSCDDAFLTFTFTIRNEMNIPLYGLSFSDVLPEPCEWVYQPYNTNGLSIGEFMLNENAINVNIDKVEPNTTASFSIDANLGRWSEDGELSNIAELSNVPDPLSDDLISIASNSTATQILASPELMISDTLIVIRYLDTVDLEVIFEGDLNISWTSTGDGLFTENNTPKTKYILGSQDLTEDMISIFVSASTDCNEYGQSVVLLFEECILSLDEIEIGECYDNETASDPTDDTFDITLNVSAQNPGIEEKYFIIQSNDTIGSFAYGTDHMITLPADGNSYLLYIEDVAYNFCNITEEVSQESCSNECIIEVIQWTVGDCDDNGTPSDKSDDTFEIIFEINALNAGFDLQYYVINSNDTLGRFDYDIEQQITLPADGNSYMLTIQDSQHETCSIEEEVIQESCSDECLFDEIEWSIGECDDNGTPMDNSDDTFIVMFEVTTINSETDEEYLIIMSNDTLGSFEFNMAHDVVIPADGNNYTVLLEAIGYHNCKFHETFSKESCSDECQIILSELTSSECHDNDTPTDPSDDFFEVSFTVANQNTSNSGQYYAIIESDTLGIYEYDDNTKIVLPSDGFERTLLFIDLEREDCFHKENLSRNHCSTECFLSLTELMIGDCNINTTPFDPTDDSYEIELNVMAINQNTSDSFFAIHQGDTIGTFSYNEGHKFILYADGIPDSISIYDLEQVDCKLEVITNQNSCLEEEVILPDLNIPNVFSPNGDNINDIWTIFVFNEDIQILSCSIFDRWGNSIYVSNSGIPKWDGTFNNRFVNDGVYVYQLEYLDSDNQSQVKVGDITLIR